MRRNKQFRTSGVSRVCRAGPHWMRGCPPDGGWIPADPRASGGRWSAGVHVWEVCPMHGAGDTGVGRVSTPIVVRNGCGRSVVLRMRRMTERVRDCSTSGLPGGAGATPPARPGKRGRTGSGAVGTTSHQVSEWRPCPPAPRRRRLRPVRKPGWAGHAAHASSPACSPPRTPSTWATTSER